MTLTGTTNDSVTLQISSLLYIEAVGNYVKICHLHDNHVQTDMLRTTSKQMEETLTAYPMIVRCHRAFLVNLGQVDQIVSHSGSTQLVMKHCPFRAATWLRLGLPSRTCCELELHSVGDVGEGQRGEFVDNLVGLQVERLSLEGLHLQILQDEVVRRVTLVDSVLH